MAVSFQELLKGIEIIAGRGLDTPVKGIHYDSRQVLPGFLFVCIKGFRTDGHRFIPDVLDRGAGCLLVERSEEVPPGVAFAMVKDTRTALALVSANFYRHPSRRLYLCGVTGTNGKTTTTHLIESILHAGGQRTGLIGTIWNKIGDRRLSVAHTTPESPDLQSLLQEMVDDGVGAVTMEVSSHGLVLKRVAECEFDAAVFTNLTQDHLDFHRDLDEYLAAKMLLFQELGRKRTKKRVCYAVINIDDPAGSRIAAQVTVPVVTYGIRENAVVRAGDVRLSARGITYTVFYRGQKIPFSLPLLGEFNVYNSLAAICVGLQEKIPVPVLQEALRQVGVVPGRFEMVDAGQDFTVIVDYAHTPDGLGNVLRTARSLTRGKLITVFGCGGDRDMSKRPLMGKIAGDLSDFTIITSDNPRTEDPGRIAGQVEAGVKQAGAAQYKVLINREEAVRYALQQARRGDLVMIAGKGHETYQIIGDRQIPFDDRQVARDILKEEIII